MSIKPDINVYENVQLSICVKLPQNWRNHTLFIKSMKSGYAYKIVIEQPEMICDWGPGETLKIFSMDEI